MIAGFTLIAQLIFAAPVLTVQWAHTGESVNINLSGTDESIQQCISGGLEVRYRYEIKVCARGAWWLDQCTERYRETRSIEFDPVSENYQLVTDVHQDAEEPRTWVLNSQADALRAMTAFPDFPLTRIGTEVPDLMRRGKVYLSIRARVYCQENEESLTTRIPYYLTLGMFRFTGYESGWVDFSLER